MLIVKLTAMFSNGTQNSFPHIGHMTWHYELDQLCKAAHVPSIMKYNPAGASPELDQQFNEGLDNGKLVEAFENLTYPDRWFDPTDAWKTIDSIHKLLLRQDNEALLEPVASIREELAEECEELRALLESAIERNLRFQVGIEEMDELEDPPFKLREWQANKDAEIAEYCREILSWIEEADREKKEKNND